MEGTGWPHGSTASWWACHSVFSRYFTTHPTQAHTASSREAAWSQWLGTWALEPACLGWNPSCSSQLNYFLRLPISQFPHPQRDDQSTSGGLVIVLVTFLTTETEYLTLPEGEGCFCSWFVEVFIHSWLSLRQGGLAEGPAGELSTAWWTGSKEGREAPGREKKPTTPPVGLLTGSQL